MRTCLKIQTNKQQTHISSLTLSSFFFPPTLVFHKIPYQPLGKKVWEFKRAGQEIKNMYLAPTFSFLGVPSMIKGRRGLTDYREQKGSNSDATPASGLAGSSEDLGDKMPALQSCAHFPKIMPPLEEWAKSKEVVSLLQRFRKSFCVRRCKQGCSR